MGFLQSKWFIIINVTSFLQTAPLDRIRVVWVLRAAFLFPVGREQREARPRACSCLIWILGSSLSGFSDPSLLLDVEYLQSSGF